MNYRAIAGIVLLIVAFTFSGNNVIPASNKIDKPENNIVVLLKGFPNVDIDNAVDRNKYASVFYAISEGIDETVLVTNIQVAYMIDYVGKNTVGSELAGKYPGFAEECSKLIEEIIGTQSESTVLTEVEKQNLEELFQGFAWKLYSSEEALTFDSYLTKAKAALDKYNGNVEPDIDDDDECPCGGKGYIVHGDGHRTECPCVASGKDCNHNPKCRTGDYNNGRQASSSPLGFDVPVVYNYRPKVGVRGMTVKYHLIKGAAGNHNAIPASYVDTLSISQQYWLHDYLHGFNRG